MNRNEISNIIYKKLEAEKSKLKADFHKSSQINSFFIDDLLPESLTNNIYKAFPKSENMSLKKSIREYKYISAQIDKLDTLIADIIFSFQSPEILNIISEITGLNDLEADPELYAGGISRMEKDNFLNPHLDNSHDRERNKYRVLNLLYYVSPEWKLENGGNLELYDNGHKHEPREILSKCNRLVVMVTNKKSVHGVNKVNSSTPRCCVSNYYFSKLAAEKENYFHVTTFYGRPEEKVKGAILNLDGKLRNSIRKVFPKGIVKNKHFYDKKSNNNNSTS